MIRVLLCLLLFAGMLAKAGDDNRSAKGVVLGLEVPKEKKFVQLELKKAKEYELYTNSGEFVGKGKLDLNGRVEVTDLNSGSYLVVVGKKAFAFVIN